ncbi:MAG: glycosyltransferase family 39 protein [Thermoleophilia bacterium]
MNKKPDNNKRLLTHGRILLLLILAALVIRILAALARPLIMLDETAYASIAENLANGKGLLDITGQTSTYFSPLYPIIIAALGTVVGDYVVAGYAVSIVFGSLILIPVYLLGREMSGARVGLLAAALLAVLPLAVDLGSTLYNESVYVFFLLMAIFFGWNLLNQQRFKCGVYTGVSLGFAYLTNPGAVFYIVAIVALAVAVALRRRKWRRLARATAVFLIVFMVIAAPYIIFLHHELGRWTYSGKYVDSNVYTSSKNLRLESPDWEKDVLQLTDDNHEVKLLTLGNSTDLAGFLLKQPKAAARVFVQQAFYLYSKALPDIIPLWLLPLLGLGLFFRGWNRRRAARVGYMALMMTPLVLILFMYATPRFFIPFVAIALIWVAEGWQRLEEWGRETLTLNFSAGTAERWRRPLMVFLAATVLLPALVFSAVTVAKRGYHPELREAGEWLKGYAGEDKHIMNRESPSAYYAGGAPVFLPYADYDRINEYARYKDIDYMVVTRQGLLADRPELAGQLLADENSHREWKLVHTIRAGTPEETLIFEFER